MDEKESDFADERDLVDSIELSIIVASDTPKTSNGEEEDENEAGEEEDSLTSSPTLATPGRKTIHDEHIESVTFPPDTLPDGSNITTSTSTMIDQETPHTSEAFEYTSPTTSASKPNRQIQVIDNLKSIIELIDSGRFPSMKRYHGPHATECAVTHCIYTADNVSFASVPMYGCQFCPNVSHVDCLQKTLIVKQGIDVEKDFICHRCIKRVLAATRRYQKRLTERQKYAAKEKKNGKKKKAKTSVRKPKKQQQEEKAAALTLTITEENEEHFESIITTEFADEAPTLESPAKKQTDETGTASKKKPVVIYAAQPKPKNRGSNNACKANRITPEINFISDLTAEVNAGRFPSITRYHGAHNSSCAVPYCRNSGALLCCEYCPNVSHMKCVEKKVIVRNGIREEEEFMCHVCMKKVLSRRRRQERRTQLKKEATPKVEEFQVQVVQENQNRCSAICLPSEVCTFGANSTEISSTTSPPRDNVDKDGNHPGAFDINNLTNLSPQDNVDKSNDCSSALDMDNSSSIGASGSEDEKGEKAIMDMHSCYAIGANETEDERREEALMDLNCSSSIGVSGSEDEKGEEAIMDLEQFNQETAFTNETAHPYLQENTNVPEIDSILDLVKAVDSGSINFLTPNNGEYDKKCSVPGCNIPSDMSASHPLHCCKYCKNVSHFECLQKMVNVKHFNAEVDDFVCYSCIYLMLKHEMSFVAGDMFTDEEGETAREESPNSGKRINHQEINSLMDLVKEVDSGRYPSIKRYNGEHDTDCFVRGCNVPPDDSTSRPLLHRCKYCKNVSHFQCLEKTVTVKHFNPEVDDFMCHSCILLILQRKRRRERRKQRIDEGGGRIRRDPQFATVYHQEIDSIMDVVQEVDNGRYPSMKQYVQEHDTNCIVSNCKLSGSTIPLHSCKYCKHVSHLECLQRKVTIKRFNAKDDFMCHLCIQKILCRIRRRERRRLK